MNKTQNGKTVKFKYEIGQTTTGKKRYGTTSISNVDKSVTDEVIFAMLALISKVQLVASSVVEVVESSELRA